MKDYHTKQRQQQIMTYQIDYILNTKEIPAKLLEKLGFIDEVNK